MPKLRPHAEPVEQIARTVKNTAAAIDCSPSHLYREAARGRIKLTQVGGRTLVLDAELKRYLGVSPIT